MYLVTRFLPAPQVSRAICGRSAWYEVRVLRAGVHKGVGRSVHLVIPSVCGTFALLDHLRVCIVHREPETLLCRVRGELVADDLRVALIVGCVANWVSVCNSGTTEHQQGAGDGQFFKHVFFPTHPPGVGCQVDITFHRLGSLRIGSFDPECAAPVKRFPGRLRRFPASSSIKRLSSGLPRPKTALTWRGFGVAVIFFAPHHEGGKPHALRGCGVRDGRKFGPRHWGLRVAAISVFANPVMARSRKRHWPKNQW